MSVHRPLTVLLSLLALAVAAPAASAYDETQNWLNAFGRTVEDFSAPDQTTQTALISAENVLTTATTDSGKVPDRGFEQAGAWPWSGDPDRGSYDHPGAWTGRKIERLSFTNELGQQLDATVWGPSDARLKKLKLDAPLPCVVFAPGVISAQPMYYWFAQGMADAGYEVLTYDLDGQGRSEGNQQPAQDPDGDLRSALTFFLSAANPLRSLLDAQRVGVAGHSLGAIAAQDVGSFGGVVKAISAMSDMQTTYADSVPLQAQGADYDAFIFPPTPSPGSDPDGKLAAFKAQAARGIDVQEVVIESATHLAWSHVTWAYTSTWSEEVAFWYALAWFDRYLYGDVARRDGIPKKNGLTGTERLAMNYVAVGDHGVSKKFRSAYSVGGATCLDMVTRDGCRVPATRSAKPAARKARSRRASRRASHRPSRGKRPSSAAPRSR
jgi:pimeloyl-ACP methyl ester carboxylesterase